MLGTQFLLGALRSDMSLGAKQAWAQEQRCGSCALALLESRASCVLGDPESDAARF